MKTKTEPNSVAKAEPAEIVVHATDATFEQDIASDELPVLVDFSAGWCGPCKQLGKVLPAIAEKFAGRLKIVKVDVDECPQAAERFQVGSIPALLMLRGGKPFAATVGFGSRSNTERWIEEALNSEGVSKDAQANKSCCG
jgi:thioredoxin 1